MVRRDGVPTASSSPRVFRGWFVVVAAFAITFLGFGAAYTFSAFLESLERDFSASRGSVSLVFSFAGFLYFGLGIVTGPAADRWGARRLAAIGMALTGAGLVLAGAAHNLGEVYAAYGLGVGLGVGCSYVPVIAAVQRWFTHSVTWLPGRSAWSRTRSRTSPRRRCRAADSGFPGVDRSRSDSSAAAPPRGAYGRVPWLRARHGLPSRRRPGFNRRRPGRRRGRCRC